MSSVLLLRESYVLRDKVYAELVRSAGINILIKQYKYRKLYLTTNYNLLSSVEGLTEQLSTKSDFLRWIICFNQSSAAVASHNIVFSFCGTAFVSTSSSYAELLRLTLLHCASSLPT